MTGSNTALNPTREAVRQRLSSQWREKAAVLAFPRGAVVYYVSGRKRNGKPLHSNGFLRALQYLAVGVYAIVAFPVVVVLGVLDDWGIQVPKRARNSGRVVVTGAEGSEAVRLADTLQTADRSLWICWSHSHAAIVSATDGAEPRIIWYASGPARPKLKPLDASLTWPDDAKVEMSISESERDHVRTSNGRP
ncbi:hypothetical protein [Haloechinothrix halophila]|uniref:hypothetical protein n=1 Tax=Haloechinothrix halophila TaxID=1069073 RepID=UPI00042842D1|nr:hypothetical protein [Haloechinothrix halophila]